MKKNKKVSYEIISIEKKGEEKIVTIILTPERSKVPDWIVEDLSDTSFSIVTIKIKERKKWERILITLLCTNITIKTKD